MEEEEEAAQGSEETKPGQCFQELSSFWKYLFLDLFTFMCDCLPMCVCMYNTCIPGTLKRPEGIRSSRTRVMDDGVIPCGCSEPNLGFL